MILLIFEVFVGRGFRLDIFNRWLIQAWNIYHIFLTKLLQAHIDRLFFNFALLLFTDRFSLPLKF